jgi:hypothetical protein
MAKKKALTYGRKFRDKSGRTVRYVYKHRKKIGLVILLAADVALPDNEVELKKNSRFRILKSMYHHGTVLWIVS